MAKAASKPQTTNTVERPPGNTPSCYHNQFGIWECTVDREPATSIGAQHQQLVATGLHGQVHSPTVNTLHAVCICTARVDRTALDNACHHHQQSCAGSAFSQISCCHSTHERMTSMAHTLLWPNLACRIILNNPITPLALSHHSNQAAAHLTHRAHGRKLLSSAVPTHASLWRTRQCTRACTQHAHTRITHPIWAELTHKQEYNQHTQTTGLVERYCQAAATMCCYSYVYICNGSHSFSNNKRPPETITGRLPKHSH